jgi:hypothetical protein
MRNRYASWEGKFIGLPWNPRPVSSKGSVYERDAIFFRIPSAGNLTMQLEDSTDSSLAAKLAEADGKMRELNACVDRQSQLITNLADAGSDIASAQIVLDSLLISIFLWVKERQRLHSLLHARIIKATAAA